MAKRPNFQEIAYWEQRYKQNVCQWYEWLETPNQLAAAIEAHLPNPSKILELGCGTSNMAEKLMTMHHQSVTCLDFSKEVIKHKQKQGKDGITYKVHDLLQPLPFDQGSFDAIIQKNTLDCLFCYEDFPARIMKVMKDCYRVLKEGGVMLSISHGKEKIRKFMYRNRFSPFSFKAIPLKQIKQEPKPPITILFLYVLTKGESQQPENNQQQEQNIENQEAIVEQEEEHEENNQQQQQKIEGEQGQGEEQKQQKSNKEEQEEAEAQGEQKQQQGDNASPKQNQENNEQKPSAGKKSEEEEGQDYEFQQDQGE